MAGPGGSGSGGERRRGLPQQPQQPQQSQQSQQSQQRLPGSDGEHALQQQLGSQARAERFYNEQMLDHLNERMRTFIASQEMFFLATSDRFGSCDNTFRAGPPGFLHVIDPYTLVFPEYRGNGVHASLGNISENPHAALLLVDFDRARIGLHINGRARLVPEAPLRERHPDLPVDQVPGRRAEMWVRLEVEEAYIHCAKHIPRLSRVEGKAARERDWGTDDYRRKGGDFFGAARDAQSRREALGNGGAREPAVTPTGAEAWREQAARALAEAERRGAGTAGGRRQPAQLNGALPAVPAEGGAWRAPGARALEGAEKAGPRGAVAGEPGEPGGRSQPAALPALPAAPPVPALPAVPASAEAWREQAARALAEAERRGATAGGGGGPVAWFSRGASQRPGGASPSSPSSPSSPPPSPA